MSDSEFLDDTEQDVSESHSKLLEAVSQLDKGQRVKKAERSEPTLEVSEFHLVKSGISDRDAVNVHDLAKVLGKKSHHLEITKNLKAARKKANILEKPLEKPAAERIKRLVGFENTKKELKKWNAIITKNRVADSLRFPLNQSKIKSEPTREYVSRFRLQSDLEKELAALEPQKENIEQKEDDFSLTLQEIVMKRKETAKIRAQQSYKEAKARRQGKIKSKKFHRVQRKEKIKLQLKEFEELRKTNPEAALEKLEQLEKSRAEERMTLRHKSTGKWAQSKQIRAKYDKESRQELAQQLSISKELTQKMKKPDDSEEEEEKVPSAQPTVNDKENPWVGNIETESEINDFIKGYRNYWDDRKRESGKQQLDNTSPIETTEDSHTYASSKGQDESYDTHSFETPNNEENAELKNVINEDTTHNGSNEITKRNFIGQDESYDTYSFETPSDEENTELQNVNNEDTTHNGSNEITKRKTLQDKSKKRLKLQKKNSNTASTSAWNVESIENDLSTQNGFVSSQFNIPYSEKINRMFDIMEDKIQERIKSKLEDVAKKSRVYDSDARKHKTKNVRFKRGDEFDGLRIQSAKQRPILDTPLDERINNNSESNIDPRSVRNTEPILPAIKSSASKTEIDPNKYINVRPKHLNTDFPADIIGGDDVLDDTEDEEKHNVISEAFADDDVVEEFRKEKQEEVEKSRPKAIDLTLPGWGSWGGKNIKVSKRKRRRFVLKFPEETQRKDENKGDVIIFEGDNQKLKEHQVTELPYPFTSVKDYEASVRMPIGRNFVPENSHRKLIERTVKTKMGKVIEPMTEDVLVKPDEKKKSGRTINREKGRTVKRRKVKL